MLTVIVGLDPGAKGAMALLFTKDGAIVYLETYDFDKGGLRGYIDALILLQTHPEEYRFGQIGLEFVRSMPGQGVKSVFSFGQRLGELEGMLQSLNLGYTTVRPLEWQKVCGVKPKSGKKGIHEVVSKLYPQAELKGPKGGIKDGRCDALGIAHHMRRS